MSQKEAVYLAYIAEEARKTTNPLDQTKYNLKAINAEPSVIFHLGYLEIVKLESEVKNFGELFGERLLRLQMLKRRLRFARQRCQQLLLASLC